MSGRSRTVAFAQPALADLDDIASYGQANWDAAQADSYLRAILDSIDNLARYPELGVARDDLALSVRVLASGQHRIFYTATHDRILVIRIVHHRVDIQLVW